MEDFEISEINSGSIDAILSSIYRSILLNFTISAPLFSKLIYNYCKSIYVVLAKTSNNISASSFRNRETNLYAKLTAEEFSIDTFLQGIDVLGVNEITLILTLETDKGEVVKKYESKKIKCISYHEPNDHKTIYKGGSILYEYLNSIIDQEGITFENLYEQIKSHYKYICNTKQGKCFVTNIARDYRKKHISWATFYRMIAAFGYHRGTMSVLLHHANGKKTLHGKSFIIH